MPVSVDGCDFANIIERERGFEKEYSKSGIYLESRRAMRKNEQRPRAENDRLQNIQLPPSEKGSAETNKQPRVETWEAAQMGLAQSKPTGLISLPPTVWPREAGASWAHLGSGSRPDSS